MRTIWAFALTAPVVLASLVLASCATDPYMTGAVTKRHKRTVAYRSVSERTATARTEATSTAAPAVASPAPTSAAAASPTAPASGGAADAAVTSKEDPRWQWCEQRHLDHQAGKAPGGAEDLEQKLKDDRTCAAVYAAQASRPQPGAGSLPPLDTGSISPTPADGY
jgi:hypothetical protein